MASSREVNKKSKASVYIYIHIEREREREMGLSYTWYNFIRVTHFCEPLITIRFKGKKILIIVLLLLPRN